MSRQIAAIASENAQTIEHAAGKADLTGYVSPSTHTSYHWSSSIMSPLGEQISCRRTFAIISHPDAGKTTLTEKLLLFGGAIQLAGAVKAGETHGAHSDWMKVERERGISVASSVMTYEFTDVPSTF